MDWATVGLQAFAAAVPIVGTLWQVSRNQRSSHAAEIEQLEAAMTSAQGRDVVLSLAYRAQALKRLSEVHGRPSTAGFASFAWAIMALLVFSLIPGTTGWGAIILPFTFLLSLFLAISNYARMEQHARTLDTQTRQDLELAMVNAREDLHAAVKENCRPNERPLLAEQAVAAIKNLDRRRQALLVGGLVLLILGILAAQWLENALQTREVRVREAVEWTAWVGTWAAISTVVGQPLIGEWLGRITTPRVARALVLAGPITLIAASLTWLPMILERQIYRMIASDPELTLGEFAGVIVAFHATALVVGFLPFVIRMARVVRRHRPRRRG